MVDLYEIKKEIVNFLRNQDIISTTNRGVTTVAPTGTFTNAATYTLATSPTFVKNIRSVVVGGVTLDYKTDYTVNFDTGVITFTVAQTGAYTVTYDYGSTDSIFPDFPQANLKLSAFPRVAVDIVGGAISDVDIGANATHHVYDLTIVCYSTDTEELEDMISAVITALLANKKTFYYMKFVTLTSLGPILNSSNKGDKVLQRNVDFRSVFNFE